MKNFFNFSSQLFTAGLLLFSCATGTLHAQSNNNMGVGTTTPDASAILDVYSNTKGLLIPRPSTAPASPAAGLMYYGGGRVNYFDGTSWRPTGLWSLNGSAARYTAGSVETTGQFFINNNNPTVYLQDTDHKSGMIHQNANLMHFLSGSGNNSTTWQINGSYWPLTLNMNNDEATFGGSAYFMEGNVGIGTTTPGYKLTIAGGTDGIGLDNTTSMYARNASGTYEVFCHPRWSDNVMYMNYGAGGFNIRNNAGASTMFMTDGGNVGIGTTSPGQKLHVQDGIYASGTITAGNEVNATGSMSTSGNLYATSGTVYTNLVTANKVLCQPTGNVIAGEFRNNSSSHATVWINNDYSYNYAPALWINSGDAFKPGGGSFSSTSDIRLKKDVENFKEGLESIRKIRPVSYHYNGINGFPTEPRFIGVIAQELQKVSPYMVKDYSTPENPEKYLTVDPNAFTYMLINSVKELDETVQKQQQKIESQQAEIDAIKTALAKAGIKLD